MSILFEAAEPIHQLVLAHFNRYDEDAIDRINHKWSTLIFAIIGIVVTTNAYVGELIKCWAPPEFTDPWVEYTDQVCWVSNTYYIPMSQANILESPRKEIVYYQWVPLALFCQALLFYIPSMFWTSTNRSLGLDINKVVKCLRNTDNLNPAVRDQATDYLIRHIDRALNYSVQFRRGSWTRVKERVASAGCICGKRYGNYLILMYLLTKFIYLGFSVFQIYALQHFLGSEYFFYGIQVLRGLVLTGDFKESSHFPRVTLCDFKIRAIGKTQQYSVQCALPVNLFNEKIFTFVWFWLALLSILNMLSIIYWIWVAVATNRRRYIKTFLRSFDKFNKESELDRERLNYFCMKYLRPDGYFLLRMIGKNSNDVVVGEIIKMLWRFYAKRHDKMREKHEV